MSMIMAKIVQVSELLPLREGASEAIFLTTINYAMIKLLL